MVRVTGLDHLVLAVADVERSLDWYCGVLGLAGERVEEWRGGKVPFPSVRVSATTIIDLVVGPTVAPGDRNLHHFCLVVEPTDLGDLGPPATRFGALGLGTSVYVEDPDGNVVELRHYGPVATEGPPS